MRELRTEQNCDSSASVDLHLTCREYMVDPRQLTHISLSDLTLYKVNLQLVNLRAFVWTR